MQGTVTSADSSEPASTQLVKARLAARTFFWLDVDGVDDDTRELFVETFDIHPLAVRDAVEFGRSPKVQDYGDFAYMVAYGAELDERDRTSIIEVHFIFAHNYVITVHRGDCPMLDAVRDRIVGNKGVGTSAPHVAVIYLVIDQLVDSFFPVLDGFDDQIDSLEDQILAKPTDEQLATLFEMKRTLITIRKVVTPQRDVFASIVSGVVTLPGVDDDGQRYIRDLYDHLIRISDLVDSYRDLLSGAMDTHLSTVSNRLNAVMKQLTIIATVFLPLSFLTGFFGQNFGFLTGRINSWWAFITFGIGLELVSAFLLLYFFRRRGWLGGASE